MAETVVISGYVRTPFGKFNGALKDKTGPELGAFIIDALLKRTGIAPKVIEAAYLGVGMIGGATLTPVRQAVLMSDLPQETPSLGVDRACCSGMTAVGLAFKDIRAGEGSVLLAGGFESQSRTPYLLPRSRDKAIGAFPVGDPLLMRGQVVDPSIASYTSAEALAQGIDRRMQDEWALGSHRRYMAADADGYFEDERIAIPIGAINLTKDESPRVDTSYEKLAALKTVHGAETITAGNAPGLSDGAAALLVLAESKARALGLPILAKVRGYAQVSDGPTSGSFTPAIAIQRLLRRHEIALQDVDAIEINEAFAATPLVSTLRLAGGDQALAATLRQRTNISGGAVAIGHPLGASGARLTMTLINALSRRGGGCGVAAICGGFGQGDAILIEVDG
jgi:acetyl-CoA C-acetyltransferase